MIANDQTIDYCHEQPPHGNLAFHIGLPRGTGTTGERNTIAKRIVAISSLHEWQLPGDRDSRSTDQQTICPQ